MNADANHTRPPDLDQVLDSVWTELARAVVDAEAGWRLPVLGTLDGSGPVTRTVVLRHADRAARRIGCHTDRRSPKVRQIAADPRVSWLFYDTESREQLSVRGQAEVLTGGPEFDAAWERTDLRSRRCYLAPFSPGRPLNGFHPNLPEDLRDRPPVEAESAEGRKNFAVVDCLVSSIDWLRLDHRGHQRARFLWNGDRWEKTWIAA